MSGGPILAALALAAAPGDLTARIDQAAAAAQQLQGPLDGAWVLVGRRSRPDAGPLFRLQIVDTPGASELSGAWTERAVASARPIARLKSAGPRLEIELDPADGDPVIARLDYGRAGWTGVIRSHGAWRSVALVRPSAAP